MKVIVVHRTADTGTAERLAKDIEAAGRDVQLDALDVQLGDSIIRTVDRKLVDWLKADIIIPLLPDEGQELAHAWWGLAQWNRKVLPALLPGGQLPALFADVKPADLTDWDTGVKALRAAIGGR